MEFSVFDYSESAKNGKRYKLTVDQIVEKYFRRHEPRAPHPGGDLKIEKNGKNFSLAQFIEARKEGPYEIVHRCEKNISGSFGLCIDVDNKGSKLVHPFVTKEFIMDVLRGYRYILHTTHSHMLTITEDDGSVSEARPKYRIILFFDRVVTVEEFKKVARYFTSLFPKIHVDNASESINYSWYLPSCRRDSIAQAEIIHNAGNLVDVEKILDEEEKVEPDQDVETGFLGKQLLHETKTDSTSVFSYTTTNDNVKPSDEKIINTGSNLKILFKDNPLFNQGSELFQRVLNVLSEPEMHVKHFCNDKYLDWINIGCALKGMGMPVEVFDKWSSFDPVKYKGAEDTYYRWAGFKGDPKEGTIFKIAKERGVKHYLGYKTLNHKQADGTIKHVSVYDYSLGGELPDGYVSYEESLTIQAAIKKDRKYFPTSLVDTAPAPLKLWIDYVLDTSLIPLPILALASGISTFGMLYHHKARIEAPFRTASNIYTLGIALSGTGKNHSGACITQLFTRLNLLNHLEDETPGSGHGILTGLRENKSSLLFVLTEFQRQFLERTSQKATAASMVDIESKFTDLFSKTHQIITGRNLIKDMSEKGAPIPYPHISLYGVCTPEDFYKYYQTPLGTNGFLGRMVPFILPYEHIEERDNNRSLTDIPRDLIRHCEEILNMRADDVSPFNSEPSNVFIPFQDEEHKKYVKEVGDAYRKKALNLAEEGNTRAASIYNRVRENALKIALVAQEGGFISRKTFDWALEVADTCAENVIANALDEPAESIHHSNYQKVQKVLRDAGAWVSAEHLLAGTRPLKKHERDAVIEQMVAERSVVCRLVPTKGKPKTEYLLVRYNK